MKVLQTASGLHPAPVAGFPGPCDSFVPSGRIGQTDLRRGAWSFAEIMTLAAQDLADTGCVEDAARSIRAGLPVRAFLTARYCVPLGPREAYVPSHRTPDGQDAWEFLRVLRRARSRAVKFVQRRAA
jgi:hypothetical protein